MAVCDRLGLIANTPSLTLKRLRALPVRFLLYAFIQDPLICIIFIAACIMIQYYQTHLEFLHFMQKYSPSRSKFCSF